MGHLSSPNLVTFIVFIWDCSSQVHCSSNYHFFIRVSSSCLSTKLFPPDKCILTDLLNPHKTSAHLSATQIVMDGDSRELIAGRLAPTRQKPGFHKFCLRIVPSLICCFWITDVQCPNDDTLSTLGLHCPDQLTSLSDWPWIQSGVEGGTVSKVVVASAVLSVWRECCTHAIPKIV